MLQSQLTYHRKHITRPNNYRISWAIRRTFFPQKMWPKFACVLCAEGKYYFQTYKYLYIYYTTSLSWRWF